MSRLGEKDAAHEVVVIAHWPRARELVPLGVQRRGQVRSCGVLHATCTPKDEGKDEDGKREQWVRGGASSNCARVGSSCDPHSIRESSEKVPSLGGKERKKNRRRGGSVERRKEAEGWSRKDEKPKVSPLPLVTVWPPLGTA